jgi:hypothetical protein
MREARKNAERVAHHLLPFPCVVYVKKKGGNRGKEYEFSHYCRTFAPKKVPCSLRVRDLHEHACSNTPLVQILRKTCFMVLVTGDVAQCVCSGNTREKRSHFLYRGSNYAIPSTVKKNGGEGSAMGSEFHDDYVPLHFYSTLSTFSDGFLCSVTDIECGLALFPRFISDCDLETLGRWVDHNLIKSVQGSVWVTNQSDSYNEHTQKIQRRTMERLFPPLLHEKNEEGAKEGKRGELE